MPVQNHKDFVDSTIDLLPPDEHEDLAAVKAADITVVRTNEPNRQTLAARYILLPLLFITVALLGGLRIAGADSTFIFVRPALLCLIFAAIMLVLIFRAGLVRFDGWLAEDLPIVK